jgi:hypothetical protein
MVDLQGARCGTTPAPAIDRMANRADVVHERRLRSLFYVVRCGHFVGPDQVHNHLRPIMYHDSHFTPPITPSLIALVVYVPGADRRIGLEIARKAQEACLRLPGTSVGGLKTAARG